MATTQFIQNLLSKEDCEKILKRSLDFPAQVVSYKIKKYHENVAGFMGDHLSLIIKYQCNKTLSRITYFLKTTPLFNENQLNYVVDAGIFKKEVILYQHLLSDLLKIRKFGPECYFITENILVLEDLKAKGFSMNPKELFLSHDQSVALLKTLARFHASSIIYEEKWELKLNEKFKNETREACFSFTEGQPRYKWLLSTTQCVMDLIKLSISNHDVEEICAKYGKFIFTELEQHLKPSNQYRNVLLHDDLWCNNILFNVENECLFVDYQLTRYAPPCLDFLTALSLNLNCNDLQNNLDVYIDIYYSFLVEELEKNNLKSNLLPKTEFKESLEAYKLPAFIESVMYGTHIYISEELSNEIVSDFNKFKEFSFINRSKYAIKEFQENSVYRQKILPYLELLVETLANRN